MRLLALFLLLILAPLAHAAEWKPIEPKSMTSKMPGYGRLTGVLVHPTTGDVYAFLSDHGLFRSTDQGATWKQFGSPLKGRTEWPGTMILFPGDSANEKPDRFLVATVYNGPIVTSAGDMNRDGKWNILDKKSNHVDWCAVSPNDPNYTFMLTLKHESGDLLLRSNDGGKSFTECGKGYGPACVFDSKTAVVQQGPNGKRKALRTTDGGETFKPCADFNTRAMPQWRGNTPYWLVDGAIMTSSDQGETWKQHCAIKDGRFGPIFGKDDKHLLVVTPRGIVESRDAGSTWSTPIALAKPLQANSPLTWLGYDAKRDTFYVAQMGADLYRLTRGN
jgi:hypothetical protein